MQQLKTELIELINKASEAELQKVLDVFWEQKSDGNYMEHEGVFYRMTKLEVEPTGEMKISPSEQAKPYSCYEVMATYRDEEYKATWYGNGQYKNSQHWELPDCELYGSDIALVTSWREIA